jgi:hypothetical protein
MNDQPETVEDALGVIADIIDSEQFTSYIRQGLDAGHELNYRLKIIQGTQGIVVAFVSEKKLPARPLKTFVRLQ